MVYTLQGTQMMYLGSLMMALAVEESGSHSLSLSKYLSPLNLQAYTDVSPWES